MDTNRQPQQSATLSPAKQQLLAAVSDAKTVGQAFHLLQEAASAFALAHGVSTPTPDQVGLAEMFARGRPNYLTRWAGHVAEILTSSPPTVRVWAHELVSEKFNAMTMYQAAAARAGVQLQFLFFDVGYSPSFLRRLAEASPKGINPFVL